MDLQIISQDLINKIIIDNNKKYSTLLFNIVFFVSLILYFYLNFNKKLKFLLIYKLKYI